MDSLHHPPPVVLEVNGYSLPEGELAGILGSIRVQQHLSQPTQCEIILVDPPAHLFAAAGLNLGKQMMGSPLKVHIPGQSDVLFSGDMTALEYVYNPAGGREVRIRAYDVLHRLRHRQTVRSYVQMRLGDMVKELAKELGLTVEAPDGGPLWQQYIQHRQSDLDVLTEMSEYCGFYLFVRENVLHLLTLAGMDTAAIPLILGTTLFEAQIELNGYAADCQVETTGWSPLRAETVTAEAAEARTGRAVDASVSLRQMSGKGKRSMVDEVVEDDAQARALAQAELDRHIARQVTLWGVAAGNTSLQPGVPVTITGVDDTLAGTYILTGVKHTISSRTGFVSELSTMPPTPPTRTRGTITTIGIVSRVDDPDNLGRVRVKLPTYNDVESEWLGVLSVAAGEDKGLTALPDVDDCVLVLLPQENPAQGVVLGGLYGMGGSPDSGIEGYSVQRYTLLTRGGQRIQLDDSGNLLRLENNDGSYIELAPDLVRLHAVANLDVEAPGQSVTIRGKSINFERG